MDGIREYLRHNWATMKSVSFLPHSDHGFDQAPLEEITKDEYLHLVAKVVHTEDSPSGGISELLEDDCLSGACPIR